jgi:hypothetical protein
MKREWLKTKSADIRRFFGVLIIFFFVTLFYTVQVLQFGLGKKVANSRHCRKVAILSSSTDG